MKQKAVVLLSSGLDSTVNLYAALREYQVVQALTFDYGQRAAAKEKSKATKTCKELDVPHQCIDLPWLGSITQTSLVNTDDEVPVGDQVGMDDMEKSAASAAKVWVPNRNGVFLNIAASFADSLGAEFVIPGFNVEEAATFPDNSQGYMTALDNSFSFSTSNSVQVKCFTTELNKTEIVRLGKELSVNFDNVWPCYFANESLCGQCESCQRYLRAMEQA